MDLVLALDPGHHDLRNHQQEDRLAHCGDDGEKGESDDYETDGAQVDRS